MARRLPAPAPVLPGYRFVRPLGTGGFADVYLFEQDMPRRQVAVKVLLSEVVDADVLRMFNAEADVMARLSSHPSILTVYQASISADGRPYLVMEFCPVSISDRYRTEHMPVAEVLHIGVRIGSALETAHRAGVLHRDVKPSNILITGFGAPVLADFGIATSLSNSSKRSAVAMSVPWSSPEVIEERTTGTIASEVWSLGATVYSLLAGRSPFEVRGTGMNSREQLASRIRRAKYVETGREDVPPALEELFRKTLSHDPSQRPPSAQRFAYELQLVQHSLGLPVTQLEVASNEWTPQLTHGELDDASHRGPVRSSVSYPKRRRETASGSSVIVRGGFDEGTEIVAPKKSVSVKAAVLVAIGVGLLVAGIAVVAFLLIGGN